MHICFFVFHPNISVCQKRTICTFAESPVHIIYRYPYTTGCIWGFFFTLLLYTHIILLSSPISTSVGIASRFSNEVCVHAQCSIYTLNACTCTTMYAKYTDGYNTYTQLHIAWIARDNRIKKKLKKRPRIKEIRTAKYILKKNVGIHRMDFR